jgi:hypothetical protein
MPVGHSHVWGVPLACLGCFLPAWHDEGPGCRCGSGLLSSGAGSARCVSRLWCAERALGRGEGAGRGCGGNRGKRRALGGLPRVSPATLAASTFGRPGAAGPCAARSAAPLGILPRSLARREPGSIALSMVIGAAGSVVAFRGEAGGVWGTWNRGRDFPGPGAVPGSPVRFRIGLSFCLFTRVVEP